MGLLGFTSIPRIRRRIRSIYVPPAAIGPLKPLVSRRASDPRLVGAAFDYALRFFVERLNPKSHSQAWVAEQFVQYVEDYITSEKSMLIQSGTMMVDDRLVSTWTIDRNRNHTLAELQRILQWARAQHQEYLLTGYPREETARACCILARFDFMWRKLSIELRPEIVSGLQEIEQACIDEILDLLSLVNPNLFLAQTRSILNPRFRAAELVGGAEADLLIDDRLIEIKVSERRRPDLRDWDQLFGYYALYKMGGMVGVHRGVKIRRLGIFSARYHNYYEIELRGKQEAAAEAFAEWFAKRLDRTR